MQTIFPEDERNVLWDHVGVLKFVDWILIQMYMGWRPQELAILWLNEVNLDEQYIQGGMKTNAGKQRCVPIHSRIQELIKKNYDEAASLGSEFLFNDPAIVLTKLFWTA